MADIVLPGVYTNGTTADGTEVQTDMDAVETFLNTTGVHVYQAGTVDATALAANAVIAGKINAGAIVNADISATAEIAVSKLADGAAYAVLQTDSDGVTVAWVSGLTANHIASDAITTAKILDANVTTPKLADSSVSPRKIANVHAAHTSNVADLNAPGASLGGATIADGEYVLLVAQSTASQNGVWQYDSGADQLDRPDWYDNDATDLDAFVGFEVAVKRGTYAGKTWRLAVAGADPILIDTTSTEWHMVGYSESGLTASRPDKDLVAPGGIYVDREALTTYYLNDDTDDWAVIPLDASGSIANGAITTDKLADGAVTFAKLDDDAVAPRNVTRIAAVHTSSDITIANPGTSTLGGATIAVGEYVILAAQSPASENGPWLFNGSGVALTRPDWYDNDAADLDAFEGATFLCLRGTYAGKTWRLTTAGAIEVDVTSTSWQMVDYSAAGTTGNQPVATLVAAGGVYYDTTTSTPQRSDGSTWSNIAISSSNILNGTIVNDDVNASAAIAYSKLNLATSIVNADVAVGAAIAYSKLSLTGSIVNADISASAEIAVSKLADGAAYDVLGTNSDGTTVAWVTGLTDNHISATAEIAVSKLADGGADDVLVTDTAGTGVEWVDGLANKHISATAEIAVSKLADGAAYDVLTTDAAGTGVEWTSGITNNHVSASAEIAVSKLADGAAYDVLQTNSDGTTVAWVSGLTANHIASGAITPAKLGLPAVGLMSATGTLSVSTANPTDLTCTFTATIETNTSYVDVDAANFKIIAKATGLYRISGALEWASNSTGYRKLSIEKNAVDAVYTSTVQAAKDADTVQTLPSKILSLTANDELTMKVAQASGSPVLAGGTALTFLQMEYLGPAS